MFSTELSEEESDYEFDYEVLSAGSAEPFDDTLGEWISATSANPISNAEVSIEQKQANHVTECDIENWEKFEEEEGQASTSAVEFQDDIYKEVKSSGEDPNKDTESYVVSPLNFEDLEQLMSEIGNVRNSLRLMPDHQRKEMAANLAMKMASMFGGGSDDEDEVDI